MGKHLFDTAGRISAEALEEYPVALWQPPEIDARGHLVQVQPRPESSGRDGAADAGGARAADPGQSAGEARGQSAASAEEIEAALEQARAEGFEKGRAEGLEKGRQEGLQLGREEGREQALRESRQKLQPELAALNRLATSLTHALNEQDYQLEQALMHLVREIARQVIQRELKMDNSTLMPLIRQALKTLPPGADNVRILVHPDDLPLLQRAIEEGGENWRALARDDVARGGCRIETDQSVLDFTTGYRFRRVIEQVMEKQFADPAAAEEPFEEAPEPLVPKDTAAQPPAGEAPDAAVHDAAEQPLPEDQ